MPIPINGITLDECPPAHVIQQGWLASLKNRVVFSIFLGALAFQSLNFFKDKANFDPTIQNSEWSPSVLSTLSYASLLLNLGVCISTLVFLEYIRRSQSLASQKPGLQATESGLQDALELFGVGHVQRWLLWHWLFCFIFGFLSVFTPILAYVWLQEPKETKIAITALGAFSLVPIFTCFLLPSMGCFHGIGAFAFTASLRAASPTPLLTPQRKLSGHLPFQPHPRNRNSGTIQGQATHESSACSWPAL